MNSRNKVINQLVTNHLTFLFFIKYASVESVHMLFYSILKAVQCEYGDNVIAKQIQILITPIFIKQYDGEMMNIRASCGSTATFKISKSLRTRLYAPNCTQKPGDTVQITVGSETNTCYKYGITIDDMQVTVATEDEYRNNQKQREDYNHKVTNFFYEKIAAKQHCEERNSQGKREALQHGKPVPTPENCQAIIDKMDKKFAIQKAPAPPKGLPTLPKGNPTVPQKDLPKIPSTTEIPTGPKVPVIPAPIPPKTTTPTPVNIQSPVPPKDSQVPKEPEILSSNGELKPPPKETEIVDKNNNNVVKPPTMNTTKPDTLGILPSELSTQTESPELPKLPEMPKDKTKCYKSK